MGNFSNSIYFNNNEKENNSYISKFRRLITVLFVFNYIEDYKEINNVHVLIAQNGQPVTPSIVHIIYHTVKTVQKHLHKYSLLKKK